MTLKNDGSMLDSLGIQTFATRDTDPCPPPVHLAPRYELVLADGRRLQSDSFDALVTVEEDERQDLADLDVGQVHAGAGWTIVRIR